MKLGRKVVNKIWAMAWSHWLDEGDIVVRANK